MLLTLGLTLSIKIKCLHLINTDRESPKMLLYLELFTVRRFDDFASTVSFKVGNESFPYSAGPDTVSYTHLDVYKRQLMGLPVTVCIVQELIRGWQLLTKSGRTMDTVAPVSIVNDVGLPSANPLTISFHWSYVAWKLCAVLEHI